MLRPTPTTVEPLRVSPPEAVAYQFELALLNPGRGLMTTTPKPRSRYHSSNRTWRQRVRVGDWISDALQDRQDKRDGFLLNQRIFGETSYALRKE